MDLLKLPIGEIPTIKVARGQSVPTDVLPVRFNIAGIPVGLSDPHNEALPLWAQEHHGEPMNLFRVDTDSDMAQNAWTMKRYLAQQPLKPSGLDYARTGLHEANFNIAGVAAGLVGPDIFWPRLSDGTVFAYQGLSERSVAVYPTLGELMWKGRVNVLGELHPSVISREAMLAGLRRGPFRVDVDLDAIIDRGDKEWEDGDTQGVLSLIDRRLIRMADLLSDSPFPEQITVIRSQHPTSYVPPEYCDLAQSRVIDTFWDVYGR